MTSACNVLPQVNFPTNNLNFYWRWWDRIKAIFLNLFYFTEYDSTPLKWLAKPSLKIRTPNAISFNLLRQLFFKPIMKASAFYLEKQKSFIPINKIFFKPLSISKQKALFTDSIFREGLMRSSWKIIIGGFASAIL